MVSDTESYSKTPLCFKQSLKKKLANGIYLNLCRITEG